MLDWIISLSLTIILIMVAIYAHSKTDGMRTDGRPHLVPWRAIMIACVFGLFLVAVHLLNLIGVETGPENSLFGRF